MKKIVIVIAGGAVALVTAGFLAYKYVPTTEGSAFDRAKDRIVGVFFRVRDRAFKATAFGFAPAPKC